MTIVRNEAPTRTLSAVLCADWGKELKKRAVYVADVSTRIVRRVPLKGWTAAGVLEEAKRRSLGGSVLATFDAPLGVPESFLAALRRSSGQPLVNFLELLAAARSMPRFFDASSVATDWGLERPFFSVPAGQSGLRTYMDSAAEHGVDIYREIDRLTGAKPVFVKSGIPGSVGSAACALWQELAPRLTGRRAFRVWPFEGNLETLLQSTSVVLGEIYPRAAYATALGAAPIVSRPRLVVAKTDPAVRRQAIASLLGARWLRSLGVTLENLDEAEASEDDFDAFITAAALLRCILDGSPLCSRQFELRMSEGGILGTGSVNLRLRQQTFGCGPSRPASKSYLETMNRSVDPVDNVGKFGDDRRGRRAYRCPIVGCDRVFHGSRGGWDGHVGSLRLHSDWHPELQEPEQRKRRFEIEFPDFFK